MAETLRFKGVPEGLHHRTLGRLTYGNENELDRQNCFLAITRNSELLKAHQLDGYAAILVEQDADERLPKHLVTPMVSGYQSLGSIEQDSVLAINPDNGQTYLLYRPMSSHNVIFTTTRCNSNCIMCSQPPVFSEDYQRVEEHLRLIDLINKPPKTIGISGGEPTLLGTGLVKIISRLKERFPETPVHMLTNGRLYAYEDAVIALSRIEHPAFTSGVPLYSEIAAEHDYIVQARGAFDQTMKGLYNAARYNLPVEIRVVLHKHTLPRLVPLMEFIYRNLPFVRHVALMGLENMGYVKKNWDELWVDPVDYAETLEKAVQHLFYRKMHVSIYNLQLCVLPKQLWVFARNSISDYKHTHLDICDKCSELPSCCGLFTSSIRRHSRGIHSL